MLSGNAACGCKTRRQSFKPDCLRLSFYHFVVHDTLFKDASEEVHALDKLRELGFADYDN